MDIKISDRIRNNDPRFAGQVVTVDELFHTFSATYAVWYGVKDGKRVGRKNKVRTDRIFPAGTNCRQGWTLVGPAQHGE